jgi:hypothetical protein
LCASAAGAIPSAIAQKDTSLGEDLARSIVSDVLDSAGDGSSTASSSVLNEAIVELNQEANENNQQNFNEFGDDDATQVQVGMQDQNQRTANLAAQLGLNLDLDLISPRIPSDPPTPDEEPTPECPTRFTLNNNGQCERTVTEDPKCPIGFTFNPNTDQCESSTDPICTAGTFNPATDQCEQRQTQPPT